MLNPTDYTGHGFTETYINDWGNDTRQKIREAIEKAFSSTLYPHDCDTPPEAVLTVSPSSGEAPLTVSANASGSTDDGEIVNYTFNFGDGEPRTGAQNSAQHVYEKPGTYTVSVTVTDDGGKTDSAAETVEVLEGEYIGHFEYEYTAVHDNEVNWAGYECGTTNQITGTEKQRNDRKIISSATILFGSKMSGGELQLYALSVQGGSHTETSVGQNVTPTTTKNSNYSSNATGADFVPGGGSLYIRYTSSSFRQEFSTTNCGETDTTVTVGEPPSATQFRWDGSLSGSETEGEVVRDYCDTYGCYFFSYEEQFRWEITPK